MAFIKNIEINFQCNLGKEVLLECRLTEKVNTNPGTQNKERKKMRMSVQGTHQSWEL